MPRSNPITMTFPPFAGTVRKLVLANVAVFFASEILLWLVPAAANPLLQHLQFQPKAVLHGEVWQLVTYSFLHYAVFDILFAMLTLWFCGSMLEGAFGGRWFAELYFTSVIGGAVIASAIAFTHILHLTPDAIATGASTGIFGILMAIAMRFGDQEFLLFFVLRIRAKYMVTIYILIAVAVLLKNANAFGALLQLAGALSGFLYVRYASRRGFAYGLSERYFALRNDFYRAKRRRAARKFEVYMGKQGRQVHFDKEGRYMDPDEARKDPTDKRWMN